MGLGVTIDVVVQDKVEDLPGVQSENNFSVTEIEE
jgi:hypothetical protein